MDGTVDGLLKQHVLFLSTKTVNVDPRRLKWQLYSELVGYCGFHLRSSFCLTIMNDHVRELWKVDKDFVFRQVPFINCVEEDDLRQFMEMYDTGIKMCA